MKSVIQLENTGDLATVVQHWHSMLILQLAQMTQMHAANGNNNCVQVLNDVHELIHKLPYNTSYVINQEVVSIS